MGNAISSTYSIAVFPFLKTTGRVLLGDLTFRSSDDLEGLPSAEAASVTEVASMLFLQDDLRIRSASCALVPFVDMTNVSMVNVHHIANIQAVVAYLYASPHEVFGDPFLTSEHASMVIFSPGSVSRFLVQPDFHVEPVAQRPGFEPDQFQKVRGYDALYNFRHHFWVTRGSRVYGPQPHLTLNQSQDLYADVERAASGGRAMHGLLLQLLAGPVTASSSRVFTAIKWFSDANREGNGHDAALVSLAIAFESLLGLPQTEKTDRLVDAIALLLGRVPRLDAWAHQFYRARGSIVHEGRTERLHFVATDSRNEADGPAYQSLLSFGMRIFRLCLSTLMVGADLAHQAGLEEILVTNQQRFQKICETLKDTRVPAFERLTRVEDLVEALDHYKFLAESGLQIDTMVSAVRLAVEAVVDCNESLGQSNRNSLLTRITTISTNDRLKQLEAVQGMETLLVADPANASAKQVETVRKLVNVVWGYVFPQYYSLKQQRDAGKLSQ